MIGWIILLLMSLCRQLVCGESLNGTIEDRDRDWKNKLDEPLTFECGQGQHISRIISQHDNKKEDRRWDFECRQGYASDQCYWTDWANTVNSLDSWERMLDMACVRSKEWNIWNKGVLVGVHSVHYNRFEERKWKFKCCDVSLGVEKMSKKNHNCDHFPINELDGPMDYKLPYGYTIVGVHGEHHDREEDRIWRLDVCRRNECTLTSIKLPDDFLPKPIGTSTVGIGVWPICKKGAHGRLSITNNGSTRQLSQSLKVSIKKRTNNINPRPYAIGESLTIDGMGGGKTFDLTETTKYNQIYGLGKLTTNELRDEYSMEGISGGIVIGSVDEYQLDNVEIEAQYNYKCTSPGTITTPGKYTYHTETDKLYLNGHFYGPFKKEMHSREWKSEEDCRANELCLLLLSSIFPQNFSLSPSQLLTLFKKCF